MANIKISDLTAAAAATGTQEFEVNDSLTSKKVTGAQILAYVEGEVSSSPSFTGQVSIDDGSASAPSLTNTGDTNTGLYFPAADTVAISTGGTKRLEVNSSGTVTLSNNQVIEVTDNSNAALRITQLGTGNALVVEDSTNPDSSPFVVNASGNVGIGTTTPAYPLDVNGNVNASGTMVMGSSFLRNRIINGDMRIDQRNAGASVTPTSVTYTLDRWAAAISLGSKFSVQQSSTAPDGFDNSLLVTSLSAYSVAAGDTFAIRHLVEGYNVSDLGWGTASAKSITLSFWVRSSLTGTFGGAVRNSASNRSYPFTYTISSANTWEQKSVTIPGDTSGTWVKENGVGVNLTFGLGVGSSNSSTAGSWAAGNYPSATGAVSVVGTNAATWYITGVQLEAGTVATPFERRLYGQELALCQRYYEIVGLVVATSLAATAALPCAYFAVEKRANPTISTLGYDAGTGANFASSNQTPTKMLYQSSTHSQQAQAKVAASSEL